LTEHHNRLGLDYVKLQGTLQEKDSILLERQKALDENREVLATLNAEKDLLAEQRGQIAERERILWEQ
jgi:hypothetical protein